MSLSCVIHPIYGKGTVIEQAFGCFSWVQSDNPTNVRSNFRLANCLAVSLNVCRRA